MLDPFDLVPSDLDDVMDARLRNRWYQDENDRLRKTRELRVIYSDLSETLVPMVWDTEVCTWVEDKRTQRIQIGKNRTFKLTPKAEKEQAAIIKRYQDQMN